MQCNDMDIRKKIALKSIEQKIVFLNLSDILYATIDQRKTVIVTPRSQIQLNESLNTLQNKLPQELFMRVHKSFIVNLYMLTEIRPVTKHTYEGLIAYVNEPVLISPEAYKKIESLFHLR